MAITASTRVMGQVSLLRVEFERWQQIGEVCTRAVGGNALACCFVRVARLPCQVRK